MNHDSDAYQALQRDLAQAYGRYGDARVPLPGWRTTEPMEQRQPMAARHAIGRRRAFLRRLKGWLQIAIAAVLVGLVLGAGFMAGVLWSVARP